MGERIGGGAVRFAAPPAPEQAQAILADILAGPAAPGPRRLDQPFALYGAGKLGRMAMDFFGHVGLTPDLVVDANAEAHRNDPYWHGRPMLAPAQVLEETKQSMPLVVSIATVCFTELAQTLSAQGWKEIVPIYDVTEAYRDRYPLGNGWFMGTLSAAEKSAVSQVLANWDDDVSRAHHLQFMAWHRLRQDWIFGGAPVDLEGRYFIPELVPVLGDQEVFLDVGAHKAEVSEAFRRTVGDRFKEVVLFEPDPRNAAKVEADLAQLPELLRGRQRLLKCALSAKGGRRSFFAGLGYGSQLSDLGGDTAEVTTLDALDLAPTYVKMHLEGHELEALQGAEATLRRHRPIVAVTAYHSEAGVWRLPAWLIQTLTDYRHYLRLHSWCGTGAVMYCVPASRDRTRAGANTKSSRGEP